MPWQEKSTMDQREEFVRLAKLEGANRGELCRRFGISRATGYKWIDRFEAGDGLCDQSRRPRTSPTRVCAQLEEAIVAVRKAHPAWGARKIYGVLARTHAHLPAISTIHAVLKRRGCVRDREKTSTDWQRFEAPEPNRLWQMDFKGRTLLSSIGPCHPLTIIDDHSRYGIGLAACLDMRTRTVQEQLEAIFACYGLPDAFLVDNGSPWGSSYRTSHWTPLRIWLARLGVDVIYARPFHPQTKGKNERFNRTLNEEVLALRCYRTLEQLQKAFDAWRIVYNHHRPHDALDGDVPASRYRPSQRPFPQTLPQISYHPGTIIRKVPATKAQISYRGRLWSVPKAFRGHVLAIRPTARDGILGVYFGANRVAEINLSTT